VDRPDEFHPRAFDLEPRPEFAAAVPALLDIASCLWRELGRRFDRALRDGDAHVVGRWNSVGANFRPIFADQWEHLKAGLRYTGLDEDDLPAAPVLESAGAVVYSPMIRPIVRAATPQAKAESECRQWLIDLRRSNAQATKTKLLDIAHDKWGSQLSAKAFSRAYEAAKKAAPNPNWSRPGPKQKLITPP
jgi:hypothetical protein